MAAQPETSPSTPDHGPKIAPQTTFRRAFTAPTKLVNPPGSNATAIPGAEHVETLFVHPDAKVVSFTISKLPSAPSSSSGASLPWTSPTERTVAAGKAVNAVNEIHQPTSSRSAKHLSRTQHWRLLPQLGQQLPIPCHAEITMLVC
jgi:hypothetical protein